MENDVIVIPADLLERASAEEREAYFQYLIQEVKRVDDWEPWLKLLFPQFAGLPFSKGHKDFWEWVWSVDETNKPRPWVSIWPRGHGKSTSAELAVAALAARGKRKYGLYVCHEKGTPILDPDSGEWMTVEQHPTAWERRCDGFEVRLWGLPFSEVVTPEHRYWTHTIHRRDRGHGLGKEITYGDQDWSQAQHLDRRTWVGLPIATTVEEPEGWLDDADLWWLIGLWWGDGTIGGPSKHQLSFSMAHKYPDRRDKLVGILEARGVKWGETQRGGHSDIYFSDNKLAEMLSGWYLGGNSQKAPPPWVERLPFDLQVELIRGYVDADGWVTDRDVQIASVSLTGLLAARRILARLGVPATIKQVHRAGQSHFQGRPINRQDSYAIRFQQGASLLGYPVDKINDYGYQKVFVRDGHLWSQVRSVDAVEDRVFVPITTTTHDYQTAFGRSHNCETQDQADDHVANIAAMLESSTIELAYPDLGRPAVNKQGQSKGWRRNRIVTASGFILDACGLDSAARGIKFEAQRPDFMVFDDIDGELDTESITAKKIKVITQKLLPAGSSNCATLMVQNLVHENSIFARLASTDQPNEPESADFLRTRIVSGPIPAIIGLRVEEREMEAEDGEKIRRWVIVEGEATWPEGFPVEDCEALINEFGLSAFLAECQHVTEPPDGDIFAHLDFQRCGFEDLPKKFKKVVVWVDPAVSSTDTSDSMGIQCDALGPDGKIYRLWSYEQRSTPYAAIKLAIKKAIEYQADVIGIETNQGDQLWRIVYDQAMEDVRSEMARQIDPETGKKGDFFRKMPRYKEKKATKDLGSKVTRAERMLVDYERFIFVHVEGTHVALERALKRFPKVKPYDLVDAAYWSWSEIAGPMHRRKIKLTGSARKSLSKGMGVTNAPTRPIGM